MTGVFGVVLGQILLMFLYLIIGYVLYRTGLITQEGSKALAHLLLYCVLPCVVLKSFCIEYSAKGAVELAVSIAVYAQRLGLDSSYAVQMVCLSTLLSLITLPVMLSLAAALGFA